MPVILPPTPAALPFAAPALSDALARLRQDIFDQAGSAPRWQDSDLTRAIDRALDQYSIVSPWLWTVLLPAVAGGRLYPVPPTPLGPAWWVEAVEYPAGRYPRVYTPFQETTQPGLGVPSAPVAVPVGVSGLLSGSYLYRLTFLGIGGESAAGAPSTVTAQANGQIALTLPLGPDPYCRGRRLYRTPAGGADGAQLLVATIANNVSTTFLDDIPDSRLGAALPVGDSTAGVPLVELSLPDTLLPDPAAPGSLAITAAGKHAWAANGTTIPEQHHDIVLLGAAAHACLAMQISTNDLFEYQDGELRDRVNEVKTPEHWLAAGSALLARFQARLEEVKRQRDAAYAGIAHWGGVQSRWQWL